MTVREVNTAALFIRCIIVDRAVVDYRMAPITVDSAAANSIIAADRIVRNGGTCDLRMAAVAINAPSVSHAIQGIVRSAVICNRTVCDYGMTLAGTVNAAASCLSTIRIAGSAVI